VYEFLANPPLFVRKGTFDSGIINCVICSNEYRLPTKLNGVVIDLGGHIGSFAYYAASKTATVYSYEAHPCNVPILVANAIMSHSLGYAVYPYWCAVTGKRVNYAVGIARSFPRQWDMHNTGGLGIAPKQGDMLDVPTCPIADLPNIISILPETPSWTWEQVTLIKIDVEGAEYDILENLPYRVPKIVGEYHLTGIYNSHEVAQNALKSFLPEYNLEFSFNTDTPLGLFFANLSSTP